MNIFLDGILIDVRIRYWSGAKMLTAQDLGLKEDNIAEAYVLGRKMLIPSEAIRKFRAIEGRARGVVELNSFKFPIGNARFVPKKKFPRVLEALKKNKNEYDELTKELVTNYNQLRSQMLPVYEEAAQSAFERQDEKEHDSFIEDFIERINKHYPDASTLSERFSLDWDVYEMALPRMKMGIADKIANKEIEAEIANGEYRKQTQEKIGAFMDEVVTTLRQETITLCDKIVSNIKEGKVINNKTLYSLNNFIEGFSDFNFMGDNTVANQLTRLKEDFLNKHSSSAFCKEGELQEELSRRLTGLSEVAAKITDISTVTGEYKRKINW